MARDAEWKDCPWNPGEARLLARGMAKSLIQARWLAAPGFLPDEQVRAWFPPDGAGLRESGRTTLTLLGHASTDARRLQALGVLPDHWHTSATPVPGPAAAGELVSAVQRLLSGDVGRDDPVAALEQAARSPDPPGGWERLVDWGELADLHRLLALLPASAPHPPAMRPDWDPHAGVLRYGRWLARRVDAQAENIRELLDAFSKAGWPTRIPAPAGWGAQTVHNTLDRLRENLKRITFRSERGGTMISWAVAGPTAPRGRNSRPRQTKPGGSKRGTNRG